MSKHTKGAWTIVSVGHNGNISYILNEGFEVPYHEIRANANLMEKAPVMLEELKHSTNYLIFCTWQDFDDEDVMKAIEKQIKTNKAIIEKAEKGEE